MIQLISVTYTCSSCNKQFESTSQPNPMCICIQCETKYHFDTVMEPFYQECITYTYTNGIETKTMNGFIRLICPTKSAILNNI